MANLIVLFLVMILMGLLVVSISSNKRYADKVLTGILILTFIVITSVIVHGRMVQTRIGYYYSGDQDYIIEEKNQSYYGSLTQYQKIYSDTTSDYSLKVAAVSADLLEENHYRVYAKGDYEFVISCKGEYGTSFSTSADYQVSILLDTNRYRMLCGNNPIKVSLADEKGKVVSEHSFTLNINKDDFVYKRFTTRYNEIFFINILLINGAILFYFLYKHKYILNLNLRLSGKNVKKLPELRTVASLLTILTPVIIFGLIIFYGINYHNIGIHYTTISSSTYKLEERIDNHKINFAFIYNYLDDELSVDYRTELDNTKIVLIVDELLIDIGVLGYSDGNRGFKKLITLDSKYDFLTVVIYQGDEIIYKHIYEIDPINISRN